MATFAYARVWISEKGPVCLHHFQVQEATKPPLKLSHLFRQITFCFLTAQMPGLSLQALFDIFF